MELYYAPLACSLAVRVVAREAELPLTLHQLDVLTQTLTATGASYLAIDPRGLVPLVVLDDGDRLTEVAAILLWLADQRPERALAPPAGSRDRYHLIEWLSFIATELHKKVVWPQWNTDVPVAARDFARASAPRVLGHLERRLVGRTTLVTEHFTVADAYLAWALQLARLAGLTSPTQYPALVAYHAQLMRRPSIAALMAEETPLAMAQAQARAVTNQ